MTRFAGELGGERAEDRDPATDRRLEAERGAGPPGGRLELGSVMGDDVLVRGHDRLPRAERRRDQGVRRFVAAHQLDDDVGVGIGDEMGRARRSAGPAGRPAPAGAVDVADGDPDELEPGAAVGRQRDPATRSNARTTSRPTVPAPSTATRSGAAVIAA